MVGFLLPAQVSVKWLGALTWVADCLASKLCPHVHECSLKAFGTILIVGNQLVSRRTNCGGTTGST